MRSAASALLGALLVVAGLASPRRRSSSRSAPGDGRRLLSPRRRHRQRAVEERARDVRDRGGHGRLGRQPEAGRRAASPTCHDDGRRRPGRLPRRGQVQGQQGPAPDPHGHVPEPHARGDHRGHRHQHDGGPQGQARVHRLAGERHRGHGLPGDRGGRPRQGQGHAPRAARRRRVGERDQGQEDRRLLLGRRAADGGRHRPGEHPGRADQADRPRPGGGAHEQEVRPALLEDASRRRPTRAWRPTTRTPRCGTSSSRTRT